MTRPRALVIESAYSLAAIRRMGQETWITQRDLNGFFDHVWSVNPLVGADPDDAGGGTGPVRVTELAPRHTFVEAPVGRYRALARATPLNFLAAQASLYRRLDRLVRRERIDLVRTGDPYYQGLLGLRLARKHGLPLVVRINGDYDRIHAETGRRAFPRLFPSRRAEKRVERYVLRRADLVVAANHNNLDFAVRNGADPEKTAIFRYGNLVDLVHFQEPGDRPGTDAAVADAGLPDTRILVYVGRLDAVKHAGDLVDVLARVREQHPDTGLVLVGDGPLRGAMEARAKELGILDHVAFAGSRSQAWIGALHARAAVTVAPHMGRALVEAALGAAPVVGYDLDWHRELVEEGVHGYLVPPGDVDAFADAVAQLLSHPDRSRGMGRRLREKAYEMMHPSRLNEHEREVYAALLERWTRDAHGGKR